MKRQYLPTEIPQYPLHDSSHGEVYNESHPESMVAHRPAAHKIEKEKHPGGRKHREKHAASLRGTYQDAVPKECGKARQRDGQNPIEICDGSLNNHLVVFT